MTTKWLTRTALLLALTLLFQSLRSLIPLPTDLSLFIVGSLVNGSLLVTTHMVGLNSGIIISIITPVVAFFQGHLAFPVLIPIVALGNIILVFLYHILRKKSQWIALISGALIKTVFLYFAIVHFALPVLIVPTIPTKQAEVLLKVMSFNFSWPQIITAMIGGILAFSIIPVLTKIDSKKRSNK